MQPSPAPRPSLLRCAAALIALVLGAAVLLPASAVAAGGVAGNVFALTNAERTNAGLPALVSDPALDAAAAEWARQLAASCTFEHSAARGSPHPGGPRPARTSPPDNPMPRPSSRGG